MVKHLITAIFFIIMTIIIMVNFMGCSDMFENPVPFPGHIDVEEDPKYFTGHQLIDEEYLRNKGYKNFIKYQCVPGYEPPKLNELYEKWKS